MNLRLSLFAGVLAISIQAKAVVLYDAVSSNVKPNEAPWAWNYAGVGGVVTGPDGAGFTTMTTLGSNAFQAGWGAVSPINLDPSLGFGASWEAQILQESHASDNQRAGIVVIVLGADKKGVEFGYWQDRIFAYNDDATFTPGESYALDTTISMRKYELSVIGANYSLKINGTTQLTGKTRDYSFFGQPYTTPNTLIVGDDTTRAQGGFRLKSFEVVPEPGSLVALIVAAGLLARRKR